jgi:hypothetical protein
MEVLLQFDDFYSRRTVMPVMMPANNAIAFLGVVPVGFETAGMKFKLNPHETFLISNPPVGDAIRKLRTDFLNSELLPPSNMCEKKYDSEFVLWCIL